MMEVEPTGQRSSGRNNDPVVASIASKTFARWLHHRHAPVGAYRFDPRYSLHQFKARPDIKSIMYLLSFQNCTAVVR